MDPKKKLIQAETMINELKYEQAMQILKENEDLIKQFDVYQNQFYLNIGICCFRLQRFKEAITYIDQVDQNKNFDQTLFNQAISYYFNALIYDSQHERCMKESLIFLKQTNSDLLQIVYQCRGQCLQDQGLFLAAIEEYKKSISKGSANYIDIAYCYLQIDDLEETEKYIKLFTEAQQSDIQALLIKSDLFTRTDREKEGAETLMTAYQYYKSKQFGQTDYTPKELEYLDSKLCDKNAQYIESFYKNTRKSKLNHDRKIVYQQFMKELNNKSQTDISIEIQQQLEKLLSKTFISSMKAEKDIEQSLQDPLIKDYYDSFIQSAEAAFDRASGFVNGFQMRNEDKLITLGISLLSMVPLVGTTVSSVANQLQNTIRSLQIIQRSTALVQVSNTCEELLILMKQVMAIVLRDKEKLGQIQNPHLSKSFESYMRDLVNLELTIQKTIMAELSNIYIKSKSKQQLLAIKDANELLGTYFSSGYLSKFNQKEEENFPEMCAEFVLADEVKKNELRKNAIKSIQHEQDQQIIQGKCCILF